MKNMNMKNVWVSMLLASSLLACKSGESEYDASGVFEATETIVSAEAAGKIITLNLNEGDELTAGQVLGAIDCENTNLQKAQMEASIKALAAKQNSATPQVQILTEQLASQQKQILTQKQQLTLLMREKNRVENLVKAEAVPTKQLDDVNGQVDVLKKQIDVTESQLNITRQQISSQKEQVAIGNRAIMSETGPLNERLAQMQNLESKCSIINPIVGTVLTKYSEANEMASPGKALYKIANLNEMVLRAYVTGDQLAAIKTKQQVKVLVEDGKGGTKELPGTITWISDKAEFTPKTIQTKDERANLVYAIKVSTKNDGFLKLGMYGELKF
jgi:HlyD family secretion protein